MQSRGKRKNGRTKNWLRRNWMILASAVIALIVLLPKRQAEKKEWIPGKELLQNNIAHRQLANYHSFYPESKMFSLNGEGANGETNRVSLSATAAQQANRDHDYELDEIISVIAGKSFTLAEEKLMEYLLKNPTSAEGWRYLGDCRYDGGDASGALRAYKNSLRYQTDNYWAKRGVGITSLYLGYELYAYNSLQTAHKFFQTALNELHACLELSPDDTVAAYGQALAAEGVSRELYRIAERAIGGENEETAKNIIRNCLDILDVAITASEEHLHNQPQDNDTRLVLGGLLQRRAKILQPFGHLDEAEQNLYAAIDIYAPLIAQGGAQGEIALTQTTICADLLKTRRKHN